MWYNCRLYSHIHEYTHAQKNDRSDSLFSLSFFEDIDSCFLLDVVLNQGVVGGVTVGFMPFRRAFGCCFCMHVHICCERLNLCMCACCAMLCVLTCLTSLQPTRALPKAHSISWVAESAHHGMVTASDAMASLCNLRDKCLYAV